MVASIQKSMSPINILADAEILFFGFTHQCKAALDSKKQVAHSICTFNRSRGYYRIESGIQTEKEIEGDGQ